MQFTCTPLKLGPFTPAIRAGSLGVREILGGWIVTSYFGGRIDPFTNLPANHGGMDLSGDGIDGQPLFATNYGQLQFLSPADSGGGGNWWTLYIPDGTRVGYGHQSWVDLSLNGQYVLPGTLIGRVGSTGKSTGPHLHLALDNEDAGTAYDDPQPVYLDAAMRGAYPDNVIPFPMENVMDAETRQAFENQDSKLNKLMEYVAPFGYRDQVEQDTRTVVINGVEVAVADNIVAAGWASRAHPFGGDKDAAMAPQFYLDHDGFARWIEDAGEFAFLTRVGTLNPYTQWLGDSERDVRLAKHGIVGPVPAGFERFARAAA